MTKEELYKIIADSKVFYIGDTYYHLKEEKIKEVAEELYKELYKTFGNGDIEVSFCLKLEAVKEEKDFLIVKYILFVNSHTAICIPKVEYYYCIFKSDLEVLG